jgi:hypothetical protein
MNSPQSYLLVASLLLLTTTALSQDRKPPTAEEKSRNLVSVQAGGVNMARGEVRYRADGREWLPLAEGADLHSGCRVRTGDQARAEILLNPGSYVRLWSNTEFAFLDTSIESLKMELLQGSAILEVAGDKNEALAYMSVITPHYEFAIIRSGVFRFDVNSAGTATVSVEKGRLLTLAGEVREGRRVVAGNGATVISSFDKEPPDRFAEWSKSRAKDLVTASNKQLKGPISSGYSQYASSSWYSPSSLALLRFPLRPCYGFWAYNPFLSAYTYLPDGPDSCSAFYSPYGWDYRFYNPYGDYYGYSNGYWSGASSTFWSSFFHPGGHAHHRHHHHHPGHGKGASLASNGGRGHTGAGRAGSSHGSGGHSSGGHSSGGHASGGGGGHH